MKLCIYSCKIKKSSFPHPPWEQHAIFLVSSSLSLPLSTRKVSCCLPSSFAQIAEDINAINLPWYCSKYSEYVEFGCPSCSSASFRCATSVPVEVSTQHFSKMKPQIILRLQSDSWKIVNIMPYAVFRIWLAFCGSLGELSGSRFDPTMEKK